ncbi:hypothetical protein ILYODFUR_014249 [Ilyodon furcidens]|uniref:Uncharacterized protein n=1 Tax=Ilyodon furcidens TaxID=33524 RepID=A0ABV0T834_9TELE
MFKIDRCAKNIPPQKPPGRYLTAQEFVRIPWSVEHSGVIVHSDHKLCRVPKTIPNPVGSAFLPESLERLRLLHHGRGEVGEDEHQAPVILERALYSGQPQHPLLLLKIVQLDDNGPRLSILSLCQAPVRLIHLDWSIEVVFSHQLR